MNGKAGGAARALTVRYGNAVNATRSKESWDAANRHVEEKTLIKAYLMAWNVLVENREDFMEQWTEQLQSKNLLEGYRAEKFIEYTDGAEPLTEMDTDFMLKTLDNIKVFEDGTLAVMFLDGTETECKNEEE